MQRDLRETGMKNEPSYNNFQERVTQAAEAALTRNGSVGPLDLVSFFAPPVLVMAAGVAAALVPARRAARVDPIIALRAE